MKEFLESKNVLQTIADEAERNTATARRLFSELSEAQLNWKPAPEKWSIAQCLEHLAVTSSKFDNYFVAALEGAHKRLSPPFQPTSQASSVVGSPGKSIRNRVEIFRRQKYFDLPRLQVFAEPCKIFSASKKDLLTLCARAPGLITTRHVCGRR